MASLRKSEGGFFIEITGLKPLWWMPRPDSALLLPPLFGEPFINNSINWLINLILLSNMLRKSTSVGVGFSHII